MIAPYWVSLTSSIGQSSPLATSLLPSSGFSFHQFTASNHARSSSLAVSWFLASQSSLQAMASEIRPRSQVRSLRLVLRTLAPSRCSDWLENGL